MPEKTKNHKLMYGGISEDMEIGTVTTKVSNYLDKPDQDLELICVKIDGIVRATDAMKITGKLGLESRARYLLKKGSLMPGSVILRVDAKFPPDEAPTVRSDVGWWNHSSMDYCLIPNQNLPPETLSITNEGPSVVFTVNYSPTYHGG